MKNFRRNIYLQDKKMLEPREFKDIFKKDKKTVAIQIGNSDNKLSQSEWSEFCHLLKLKSGAYGQVHFAAGSNSIDSWQNYCVVLEPLSEHGFCKNQDEVIECLRHDLRELSALFQQDSIALTVGLTEFVSE